ncbi:hypothetical protein BDU57DRAFT_565002 [Ampelomyces quisqualis]|uniref:Uncharacterized protein n=1 Tax=Ampelomyces quisqualis TaxID=50730 RepID=A0A6A5QAC6_AMPQU|nr:hypothetical protein BDU57DRAFT_565002 [Ampelomyces quisqualis]
MASTTQPWLDDLSEEWIPQRAPASGARRSARPPPPQASESVLSQPRSRLPRMRQSSGSFSEIQVGAKRLAPPRRRSVLAERSLSDNNMAPSSPEAAFSPSSLAQSSVLCGTVAHNTLAKSPVKETAAHGTPEWRRRLVKGELGYGDQTDLFGNNGLQNIFQKPSESPAEEAPQPTGKLGLFKGMAAIPSSPPPWPAKKEASTRPNQHQAQGERPDSPQEEAVEEHEDSSVIRAPCASTQEAPRTISGQIEFDNESFSPVYLTTNLKIGEPAATNPTPNFRGSELANRLRQIGSPPQNHYQSIAEESALSHSREDSSFARLQDESLPEGLPAGTPDMANVGRFVELRRGGYSRDGSFRLRRLSSSPEKELSSDGNAIARPVNKIAQDAHGLQSPTEDITNPKTPQRRDDHCLSPERAKNSGSPLKLFDAHDTFTSNRLQRRLSQLEYKSEKTTTTTSDHDSKPGTTKTVQKTYTLTSVEEASMQKVNQRRVSTFGQGQLNEFQFSGDYTTDASFDDHEREDSAPDGSPSMDIAPPGSRQPFKFQLDESPAQRQPSESHTEEHFEVQQDYAEGKRGPTSPFKNPTPKRRRTIPAADDDQQEQDNIFTDSELKCVPDILEATEAFMMSAPDLDSIQEQLEPSVTSGGIAEEARASAIASEVAAFSMKQQRAARDETRKRSVTTQDFLDEAVKIMNFIRTKGRPSSGLGSLEETEAESELIDNTETRRSSSLTFERPPSREGRLSGWREPNKRQLDPNVMSHLRKYQEKDSDTFLNSSVNSLRLSRVRGQETPQDVSVIVEHDDIRITDNPNRHNINEMEDAIASQPRTNGTQQSTGSSLGQTVATNASRRSDHVATLAPEAIAHLIPQEIAGMSFDREKNMWVRQKSPSREHGQYEEEQTSLNDSEDDPFGNIPDLTVDDIKEQDGVTGSPVRPKPTAETILEDSAPGVLEQDRPVTREGKGIALTDTSSVPSKMSNFGWSYPKTETRASSWSTQAPRNWSTQKALHPQTTYAIPESEEDDVEHEIQYYEGRGHADPSAQHHRVRDITISIAERDFAHRTNDATSPQKRGQPKWSTSKVPQKTSEKSPSRQHLEGPSTLPHARKPHGPIFNGDGDLSLLDELPSKNYRMQLSMSVKAPVLASGHQNALAAPSSPVKGDVTFMLSDLPEFTLNQIDECQLPDRVVVKHDGTQYSKALEDRYAQGTAELVKALQDAEPEEPYWEDLRKVDLHGKNLSALHRLDELCYNLEELNVSDNGISQVSGIPYTMRRLQAQNNSLHGLTSWSNLLNLQHLDISNNEIDSLDGLAELVHLRVLVVNDNKIKSLDSILHLDGLMELNDNEIDEFPLSDGSARRCKSLRSLRLCRNGTSLLSVDGHFPRLETLHVDGNGLAHVPGLEHLHHLRTFSARDQMPRSDSDTETCVTNLLLNTDVRNLYISLNPTSTLTISSHLLNLQRLELASMGLKDLPDTFGQLTPNIRSINLNFNSLKDLRPLLNIKRLDELLLAGNKLERLRANALVLGKLGTLTKLDWRDNPLTLRFYAPTSENRIMSLRHKPSDEQLTHGFVLPEGDAEADTIHLERLDVETRIRRRVTEMMLANLCKGLRGLDGLPFDKARVLVKDDIWERMLLLGVIQRKSPDRTESE